MKISICIFILFTTIQLSLGHGGGQDSKGGHHDRIHGGYHYHHGHRAHQHPNGICELNLKQTASTNIYQIDTANRDKSSNLNIWVVGVLGVGAGYLINNLRKK